MFFISKLEYIWINLYIFFINSFKIINDYLIFTKLAKIFEINKNSNLLDTYTSSCPNTVHTSRCMIWSNSNRRVIESSLQLQRKRNGKEKENQKGTAIIILKCLLKFFNLQNLIAWQCSTKATDGIISILQNVRFSYKELNSSFDSFKFLLVKSLVKFQNFHIYQNCQFWCKLSFSSYFQNFLITFEKYIVRKIIPECVDPVKR